MIMIYSQSYGCEFELLKRKKNQYLFNQITCKSY